MSFLKGRSRILLVAIIVALLGFVITLCITIIRTSLKYSPEHQKAEREEASSYITEMFRTINTDDRETIAKYFDPESLVTDIAAKYDLDTDSILSVAFKNMSGTVSVAETVDTNTVSIKLKISAPNLKKVYGNAVRSNIQKNLPDIAQNPELSDQLIHDGLPGELNSALATGVFEMTSSNQELTLRYEKGKWQFDISDELADAMLGGLNSAIKSTDINNS